MTYRDMQCASPCRDIDVITMAKHCLLKFEGVMSSGTDMIDSIKMRSCVARRRTSYYASPVSLFTRMVLVTPHRWQWLAFQLRVLTFGNPRIDETFAAFFSTA